MTTPKDAELNESALTLHHQGNDEVLARACLTVVNGADAGRVFPLLGAEVYIGRAGDVEVRLDDKPISARHAKIVRKDQRHQLIDLESTNGTFVNGRRLTPNEPVDLLPTDSIQVAETLLAYLPDQLTEATQQLSVLAPQLPGSATLGLPDAKVLAELLQGKLHTTEDRPATFEDHIDSALRVIAVLKRNWVPLVAALVLGALLGNASAFLRPPLSEASLRIRFGLTASNNPLQRTERIEEEEEDRFYEAAAQNFTSPVVVAETLQTLFNQKPTQDRIMITLAGMRMERQSRGLYQAVFVHPDPERAVKYLAAHLDKYLESEIARTLQVTQKEVSFLTTQLKDREAELRRTEEDLRRFKSEHLGGLPELATGHFQSREQLMLRRAELSAELQRSTLELDLARKRLKAEAPMLARKVARAAPFDATLVDVQRRLSEARSRGLGDSHPEVVALKRQADDLQRLAERARADEASELERNADPGLIQLQNRAGDLEVEAKAKGAQLGEINAQLERLNGLVQRMPEVEAKYAQLTRSYDVSKDLHSKLFAKLRSSELELELQRASAKARYEIVSPPQSMGIPMRRAVLARTLIGVGVGLLIGLVISAIRELRRFLHDRKRPGTAIVRLGKSERRLSQGW